MAHGHCNVQTLAKWREDVYERSSDYSTDGTNKERTERTDTMLHTACATGNVSIANLLLAQKAHVNAVNYNKDTPLHLAIYFITDEKKQRKMVELLISHGADVNMKNVKGFTPLHFAATKAKTSTARVLLQNKADPNCQTEVKNTPLILAVCFIEVEEKQKEMVKLLMSHGADVSMKNVEGFTPLHFAAKKAKTSTARVLFQNKADPNCQTKLKGTPLILAVYFIEVEEKQREMVELLISHGAYVSMKQVEGFTPLHFAAKKAKTSTARVLLQNKADPNCQTKLKDTPLILAVDLIEDEKKQREMVELLISHGAEVNMKQGKGFTPLHYAAQKTKTSTAKVLLQNKADPNCRTEERDTPLILAVSFIKDEGKQREMVKLLLEHNADPGLHNSKNKTLLHYANRSVKAYFLLQACKAASYPIVEDLLEIGVDPNYKHSDEPREFVLHLATKIVNSQERLRIVDCLLKHGADPFIAPLNEVPVCVLCFDTTEDDQRKNIMDLFLDHYKSNNLNNKIVLTKFLLSWIDFGEPSGYPAKMFSEKKNASASLLHVQSPYSSGLEHFAHLLLVPSKSDFHSTFKVNFPSY